jgi:hypothetical protein
LTLAGKSGWKYLIIFSMVYMNAIAIEGGISLTLLFLFFYISRKDYFSEEEAAEAKE